MIVPFAEEFIVAEITSGSSYLAEGIRKRPCRPASSSLLLLASWLLLVEVDDRPKYR